MYTKYNLTCLLLKIISQAVGIHQRIHHLSVEKKKGVGFIILYILRFVCVCVCVNKNERIKVENLVVKRTEVQFLQIN